MAHAIRYLIVICSGGTVGGCAGRADLRSFGETAGRAGALRSRAGVGFRLRSVWGIKIFVLNLLSAVLFGVVVHAQTPATVQAVRFTVFSAQPIKDVAFAPRAKAAPLTLAFQPTARSVRYEYRGGMPLRFVDAATGALVAEANIPANIPNALLLFSPVDPAKSGAAGLRYQIAVLDDGVGRHGPGGLAIINLSGLALTGKVNDQAVTLKPGLNPTLSVGHVATVKLSTVFKQRTYQSYSGMANLARNERALLIVFPPFYSGALEVQSRLLIDQPPGSGPVTR